MPPKPDKQIAPPPPPAPTFLTPLPTPRGLGSGTEVNSLPPPPTCCCPWLALPQVQPVDVAAPWAMAAVSGLRVEPDADAVGKTLCSMVEAAAQKAIQERGHFTLAIPGGSILKMLAGLEGKSTIDWSKVIAVHRAQGTRAWPQLRATLPLLGNGGVLWKALIFCGECCYPVAQGVVLW